MLHLQNFPQATNMTNKWPQPNKLRKLRNETLRFTNTHFFGVQKQVLHLCGQPSCNTRNSRDSSFVWWTSPNESFLHDSWFNKNKHQFLVQFWCPTKRVRLGRWFIQSIKYTNPVHFSFETRESCNLAQMSPVRSLSVWRAPFPNACLFATFARECSCHYFDRPKEKWMGRARFWEAYLIDGINQRPSRTRFVGHQNWTKNWCLFLLKHESWRKTFVWTCLTHKWRVVRVSGVAWSLSTQMENLFLHPQKMSVNEA